jgi:hypothetical protein
MNLKSFLLGREPALIVGAVSAALSLVVTLGVGLTSDEAGAITAVVTGVFGVVTAVLTRPIAPAAFTTLVTVAADLLAAYHYQVSAGTVAAVNTTVLAVLTLVTRGQVSPVPTATAPKAVPPQT